jgi:hypothetical protein
MKKVVKKLAAGDDMRPEYRLDYSKARPNRFAARFQPGSVAVVLDPDVAEVFPSGAVVNDLLRSIIRVMPQGGRSVPKRASKRSGPRSS